MKKLPDGTLMLRLYRGSETDITVPAELKGLRVTAVGVNVFSADVKELTDEQRTARTHIRSVVFSEGIKRLGVGEKDDHSHVSRLLKNCRELERISFPKGLEESCGLEGVRPDVQLDYPLDYFGVPYAFEHASFEMVIVPSGIERIGKGAFSLCRNLKNVILKDGVKAIDQYAFDDCENLETVDLPESLETIGDNAFRDCISLVSVKIPSGVKKIGSGAFYKCKGLITVEIPFGVTKIEEHTFDSCERLASVILPVGIKRIERNAFSWCESLTEINIPQGVNAIGSEAFMDCGRLQTVRLPEGLTKIGRKAFSYCDALASITIPDSVASIAQYAFLWQSDSFCINAHAGTYAELYAKKYNHRFAPIGREETSKQAAGEQEDRKTLISELASDPDWIRDKIFVLTGFDDMKEAQYTRRITQAGGTVKSSTVLTTNYLVFNPDYGRVTTKLSRAKELILRGKPIIILTEQEFLQIINKN